MPVADLDPRASAKGRAKRLAVAAGAVAPSAAVAAGAAGAVVPPAAVVAPAPARVPYTGVRPSALAAEARRASRAQEAIVAGWLRRLSASRH